MFEVRNLMSKLQYIEERSYSRKKYSSGNISNSELKISKVCKHHNHAQMNLFIICIASLFVTHLLFALNL